MRSILVVNPKGGCGKTTIATNLATYYAVWNTSVALVDLDPQESTLQWLKARPKSETLIQGFNGLKGNIFPAEGTERVIYDAPARTDNDKLAKLIKMVDVVIIPVLPSAIDMRATATFVAEIVAKVKKNNSKALFGVVANRAQRHYKSFEVLERFLRTLDIPTVGTLRNSQNYIKAADTGIGIFEMPLSEVSVDMDEWKPLIHWLEGSPVVK